jgi:hypothetical protein
VRWFKYNYLQEYHVFLMKANYIIISSMFITMTNTNNKKNECYYIIYYIKVSIFINNINMFLFHKTIIQFKLCREIIRINIDYMRELNIILKEKDGYKYNKKMQKIKKHFPASVNTNYITYNNYLIKEQNKNKNNKISYSLSSKRITEQIDEFLSTATRRYNFVNAFKADSNLYKSLFNGNLHNLHILSPLDLRHNLIKYNNETDTKKRFPYFFDEENRPFYNVIYIIKTENPFFYVDANNKTPCDSILICCCENKTFNIMFELDKKNPYYSNLNKNYPEELIEKIYNDTNI